MPKIKIEEATAKQLRYFAGTILGLEVAPTENGPSLRSKIDLTRPGLTEIDVEDELPAPPKQTAAAESKSAIPSGLAGQHSKHDPKVTLMILPNSDPTKPKDVQIAANGDTILIQRDKEVSIPYRHYLVLQDAKEMVASDGGEINPATGMPTKEWVERPSYPHQVYARPSPEEIKAWEKRTAAIELK